MSDYIERTEDAVQISDSATPPVPRPTTDSVPVNRIRVSLISDLTEETIGHFTLRGYTKDRMEKNFEKYSPFSRSVYNDIVECLPPLVDPKYELWEDLLARLMAAYKSQRNRSHPDGETAEMPIRDGTNESGNRANNKINTDPSVDIAGSDSSVNKETETENRAGPRLEDSGLIGNSKPSCSKHDAARTGPLVESQEHVHGMAGACCVGKLKASANNEQRLVALSCDKSNEVAGSSKGVCPERDQAVRIATAQAEELVNESTGRDESPVSQGGQHGDNRKRPRKTRSITEILGKEDVGGSETGTPPSPAGVPMHEDGRKAPQLKRRKCSGLTSGRKRVKQSQVDDSCSPAVAIQVLPQVNNPISGQKIDSSKSARHPDKGSSSKSRTPRVEVGHSSLLPSSNGILFGGRINDDKLLSCQSDSGIVKDQLAKIVPPAAGLDTSVTVFVAAEKNNENFGEGSGKDGPSFTRQKGLLLDLNEKFDNSSTALEMGSSKPCGENDDMDCQRESNEAQRCKKIGKASEEGCSDDVPMDIVELMAKNQYERGLAEQNKYTMPNKASNSAKGFPEVLRDVAARRLNKEFSLPGARGSMSAIFKDVGSPNMNQLSSFRASPNGVHYLAADPRRAAVSYNGGGGCGWLASPQNLPPGLGRCTTQVNSIEAPERRPEQQRGKTVSDIKATELLQFYESSAGRAFSPCNYHPRVQMDGKQTFPSFPGTGPLIHDMTVFPRQPSPALYGQTYLRTPQQGPTVRPYPQFPGRTSAMPPPAFAIREPSRDKGKQIVGQSSCDKGKQKIGAPNCVEPTAQGQLFNREPVMQGHAFNMVSRGVSQTVLPLRSTNSEGACRLNKNPADFEPPGGQYMISWRDLNFKKNNGSRKRSHADTASKQNKKRGPRGRPAKEHSRNNAS